MRGRTKPKRKRLKSTSGAAGDSVNRAGLMRALGWSRQKLIDELDRDALFPVEKRGGRGVDWEFSLAKVKARLAERAAKSPKVVAITPAQRLKTAEAELKELKLAQQRGELIEQRRVVEILGNAFAKLGDNLARLPTLIGREIGLPAEAVQRMQKMIDDWRIAFVHDNEDLLDGLDGTVAGEGESVAAE